LAGAPPKCGQAIDAKGKSIFLRLLSYFAICVSKFCWHVVYLQPPGELIAISKSCSLTEFPPLTSAPHRCGAFFTGLFVKIEDGLLRAKGALTDVGVRLQIFKKRSQSRQTIEQCIIKSLQPRGHRCVVFDASYRRGHSVRATGMALIEG